MKTIFLPKFNRSKKTILSLGAESAGNFSVYFKGKLFFSEDFGDLLDEKKWKKYQKAVLKFLKNNKIRPQIILTDLHPLFKTTLWGKELVKKYKAKLIQIQHHHAHIFSAIGDRLIQDTYLIGRQARYKIQDTIYGITMDGTGYGKDEKIWGGEAFKIEKQEARSKKQEILRIGHLENQIMIGGDTAIREPVRMLLGILYKLNCHSERSLYSNEVEGSIIKYSQHYYEADSSTTLRSAQNDKEKKDFIFSLIKKYYNKNEFELIYNQLQQKFNCLETSSTARVLDAVSILLGFCDNKRNYKHEPTILLEKNSEKPYTNLKPKITKNKSGEYILETTPLFKYILSYLRPYLRTEKKSLEKRKRLAATAQFYIAQGLYEIIQKKQEKRSKKKDIFISGGVAHNRIISEYLISKGAYVSKTIPCGDAGLSFGQIVYYLLS